MIFGRSLLASGVPIACICSGCNIRPAPGQLPAVLQAARRQRRQHQHHQHRDYHRPTFAPKPQPDIKHIARNPGLYSSNCESRNYQSQSQAPWRILELSKQRAAIQSQSSELRANNAENRRKLERLRVTEKNSGRQLTDNAIVSSLMRAGKRMKDELSTYDRELDSIEEQINALALALPNLSSTHTPDGDQPAVIEQHDSAGTSNTAGASHVDIGLQLGILDFAAGTQTSGWGWYFLDEEAALLEQALIQFVLGKLLRRGWKLSTPPSVVYRHVADACGFQPRDQGGEEQIYNIARSEGEEKQDGREAGNSSSDRASLCLAGTAEIPLAGKHANRTFEPDALPLKAVAVSRCYRAEAGARGVEAKGLYRVHEFTKVEMFAWTLPDNFGSGGGETFDSGAAASAAGSGSQAEIVFEEMLAVQREVLDELGLGYRVLEMPAHELGASAARKVDMEAWFPSRGARQQQQQQRKSDNDDDDNKAIVVGGWGEVSSASICTDYQSRRLATRVKARGKTSAGGVSGGTHGTATATEYVYTLNGTAMAVPRILAALLELGWDPARKLVRIPACLVPYMHGVEQIGPR